MIENGDKVRDTVTGFEGTVTGVAEYLTGCRQACVAAAARDGKPGETGWYDDDRLEIITKGALTFPSRTRDGGPQSHPAPTR